MRLGVSVPIKAVGLRASVQVAREAESLGYDDVWSSEVAQSDGFSPLAAIAALTTRVRLGLALAPAFTRPPALLAMSAATLQDLSDGRFVLGIGSSSPTIVERWMGGRYELPLTRVRESVEAVRIMLTGERTIYAGRTISVEGFRLGTGPVWTPIFLGALGPRMYALAGEVADGVLMSLVAADAVPTLVEQFRAAATAARRDPDELEVWCRVVVAVDEEGEALREMLRRFLVTYGAVPAYNASFSRQGFAAEADALRTAWAAGRRREALHAVSDRMLASLTVTGPAADCVKRLRAYRDAGVTTLVIDPVTTAVDPADAWRRVLLTVTAVREGLVS